MGIPGPPGPPGLPGQSLNINSLFTPNYPYWDEKVWGGRFGM